MHEPTLSLTTSDQSVSLSLRRHPFSSQHLSLRLPIITVRYTFFGNCRSHLNISKTKHILARTANASHLEIKVQISISHSAGIRATDPNTELFWNNKIHRLSGVIETGLRVSNVSKTTMNKKKYVTERNLTTFERYVFPRYRLYTRAYDFLTSEKNVRVTRAFLSPY